MDKIYRIHRILFPLPGWERKNLIACGEGKNIGSFSQQWAQPRGLPNAGAKTTILQILLVLSHTNSFKLGRDTCLLADLVGSYSINFGVPFDWNHLVSVCVYGMVASLAQEAESAFRQVPNEVTPFDRHARLLSAAAR